MTRGATGLDFALNSASPGTCSTNGSGHIYNASDTCTVNVKFTPQYPGLRSGAVLLEDASGNVLAAACLSGTGMGPQISFEPSVLGGVKVFDGGPQDDAVIPNAIATDGLGTLYMAAGNYNRVLKLANDHSARQEISPTVDGVAMNVATGLAVDGAGNLFIVDAANARVLKVPFGGGAAMAIAPTQNGVTFSHPHSIAVDGAGNLFVSDWQPGRVLKVPADGGAATVVLSGLHDPEGVTLDGAGNLFIADSQNNRVMKVPAGGGTATAIAPTVDGKTLSNPSGVAVDAAGELFIADRNNARVVIVPPGGGTARSITRVVPPASGVEYLAEPNGIAVDMIGDLWISDSSIDMVAKLRRSMAQALSFATATTVGTTDTKDGAVTVKVQNIGNRALTFSALDFPADFSQASVDANPCTNTTTLSAGASCDLPVNFTPENAGSLSQFVTLTDDALNVTGAQQQVELKGTATAATGDATTTAVGVSPTSLNDGQLVTITATVTDTTHAGSTPTGSITFSDMVGGTTTLLGSVALSANTASMANVQLSGIGTHTISASYKGVNGSFASSSNTTQVALSKASPAVTGPASQPIQVGLGNVGSAVVTVTSPYTNIPAPTGTISYSILNASQLSVSSGTHSLTVGSQSSTVSVPIPSSLASGSYIIAVTYGGDGNYLSTSTAVTITVEVGSSKVTPTIIWAPPS